MIFRYLLFITTVQATIQACSQQDLIHEKIEVRFGYNNSGNHEEYEMFNCCFRSIPESIRNAFNSNGSYEKGELVCARAYRTQENGKRTLLGLALFSKNENGGLDIDYLCTGQDYRNCKVGTKLLKAIENKYQPQHVRLYPTGNALGFYERIGFKRYASAMIRTKSESTKA